MLSKLQGKTGRSRRARWTRSRSRSPSGASSRIRSISRQRTSDAAVLAEGENRRRERGRARTIHPHGSAERTNVTVDREEARGPHLVGRTPGSDSDNLNRGLGTARVTASRRHEVGAPTLTGQAISSRATPRPRRRGVRTRVTGRSQEPRVRRCPPVGNPAPAFSRSGLPKARVSHEPPGAHALSRRSHG
jgi:hypothetical protein